MSEIRAEDKMNQLLQFSLLFAKKICGIIEDMNGYKFSINETTYCESQFDFKKCMIVYIHFYGVVQGEFLIAVEDEIAFKISGINKDSSTLEDIAGYRMDSSSFFNEILNIGVAQTIVDLEQIYENLTYFPAIAIFGDVLFPKVKSATVDIAGDIGKLKCGFSLNLVRPKIADALQDVKHSLKRTVKLANTDALTGLHNRAFFDLNFQKLVQEANQKDKKLCLIMIDVDNFKRFNDTYGHLIGDRVLSDIAEVINEKIRGGDYAVRYGGDEILIILTDTIVEGAVLVAERIRETIKEKRVIFKLDGNKVVLDFTISVGITQLVKDDNPESFFKRADDNLYRAKKGGRDRIVSSN